jgi:hypothetical protein
MALCTPSQSVSSALALLLCGLHPALQPEITGTLRLDTRLVAQQVEQHEVGVDLALHHRFQVEFDVRLAGQADVVAQDAQKVAVGEEAPQHLI